MRTQISTSVSEETRRKADALVAQAGYTYRELVSIGIDRLYTEWQERSTMSAKYESVHLYEDNAGTLIVVANDDHGPAKGWIINDTASEAPDGFVADAKDLLAGGEDSWTLDTIEGASLFDTLETLNDTDGLAYLATYRANVLHCRRTDGPGSIYDEPGRAGSDYLRADVAALIYTAADGADHRAHRAATVQAIYDWLDNGDDGYGREIADLAAEWTEYTSAES